MEVVLSYDSRSYKIRKYVQEVSPLGLLKGLPLGNLTSQLLVNIYMNEFDQFVKHALKAKYYVRYADDFVFLSASRPDLDARLPRIRESLTTRLHLALHPDKVFIKTYASGIDFLGWVHFPDHRVLRSATKRRMLRNLADDANEMRVESYRGLLGHGNARILGAEIDHLVSSHKEKMV